MSRTCEKIPCTLEIIIIATVSLLICTAEASKVGKDCSKTNKRELMHRELLELFQKYITDLPMGQLENLTKNLEPALQSKVGQKELLDDR